MSNNFQDIHLMCIDEQLRTLVSANIHKPEKSKKVPSKISSQLASIVGNDAQYRDALSKVDVLFCV